MADVIGADALLTPGAVAAQFHVTPKTIGRWAGAGILPAQRTTGGHRRFLATDVERLVSILQGVGEPGKDAASVAAWFPPLPPSP